MKQFLLFFVCVITLAGCGRSPNSQFYVLSGMGHKVGQRQFRAINIGVGPITIPKYLEQPEIVTREHNNELRLAEFHRWAESLDANVKRVVSDNLLSMMPKAHVFSFPWNANTPIDYQVSVDIRRFEMDHRGNCILKAQWSIIRAKGHKVLRVRHRSYRIHTQYQNNYRHIATLMSRNLLLMSADIGRDLER